MVNSAWLVEGKTYRVNGLTMNVLVEGEGPAVLLVHGFPDSIALWRHQIPALVAAGYRVIAPDLRGFGLTESPAEVEGYAIENHVADLVALLDTLGVAQVRLVGHDWGAVAGWLLAGQHPERVERYVAVSVGHPQAYVQASPTQWIKAYYILFFQLRGLSEWLLMRDDWWLLRQLLHDEPELERWQADLSRPGRLTAALNIYRANFTRMFQDWPGVSVPVMGVWGEDDVALTEEQMTGSAQFVTGPWRYETLGNRSGHWLMLNAPERFNALLLDYF
jgi:pimeloyl-ACP methyl ester carboxylesterase